MKVKELIELLKLTDAESYILADIGQTEKAEIEDVNWCDRDKYSLLIIKQYSEGTNADRIRAMNDEELTEFLNKYEFCNGYAKGYCNATDCKDCAGNTDDTVKWLQSEVKESEE